MAAKSELSKLREQVKEQRQLLRRSQRWIGVAAGALASHAPIIEGVQYAHALFGQASEALSLGGDISICLKKYD